MTPESPTPAERVKIDQQRYGNEWERTVLGADVPIDEQIYAREIARYRYAAQFIQPGMRVLEFGCSSGFGTRFLPADIDYTGVDYSREIVVYAEREFGDAQHTFVWSSIDAFLDRREGELWDVIIAYEVLEHVRNGREVAQRLKAHCDVLLITTPYREPVGFWGKHHVLHGLCEKDFPEFAYRYMHINGDIASHPTNEIANLLVMTWERGKTYPAHRRVVCAVPTSQRYDVLLHCLQAIAVQTVKPDKVFIYDDTPSEQRIDLREHAIGRYVFPLLKRFGIDWEVVFTPGRGQHIGHQMANLAGYDFVWRLDDDCIPEPDVLERLITHMADDVGAVGGAVYELAKPVAGGTSKIADFFHGGNVQWAPDQGVREVDFLYSSFLYRAGIVHYKHSMSPVSFHEETIFTHRMKRAGYRLIADTSIHTHHFKAPNGGTRARDREWEYAYDTAEFLRLMEREFGVKLIHLGCGLGDCFAFKNILPELRRRYPTLILGSVYNEVFEDCGVTLIPYDKAKAQTQDNVYDWMAERNWTGARGTIVDAFREMYLQ